MQEYLLYRRQRLFVTHGLNGRYESCSSLREGKPVPGGGGLVASSTGPDDASSDASTPTRPLGEKGPLTLLSSNVLLSSSDDSIVVSVLVRSRVPVAVSSLSPSFLIGPMSACCKIFAADEDAESASWLDPRLRPRRRPLLPVLKKVTIRSSKPT